MIDMLGALLDAAFIWFFTFPHWTEYLVIGFIVYGIAIYSGQAPDADDRKRRWLSVLILSLCAWPVAFTLQLLTWLDSFARWTFDPNDGVIALVLQTFARFSTRRRRPKLVATAEEPPPRVAPRVPTMAGASTPKP